MCGPATCHCSHVVSLPHQNLEVGIRATLSIIPFETRTLELSRDSIFDGHRVAEINTSERINSFIYLSCLSSPLFFHLLDSSRVDLLFELGHIQMVITRRELLDLNCRSGHILILSSMNFIMRNIGLGSKVLNNWSRGMVFELPRQKSCE